MRVKNIVMTLVFVTPELDGRASPNNLRHRSWDRTGGDE